MILFEQLSKPLDIFDKLPPNQSVNEVFYKLELIGFSQGPLKLLLRFVFPPFKKRKVQLTKIIWYVELHRNYCQIGDAKPS